MFAYLLALFIITPLLELWAIFAVGSRIGFPITILVLLLISVTGAALAKQQGYRVVARIQQQVGQGQMPGDSLVEGALILVGAVLLLTPGFITDAVGLLILFPPTRSVFRRLVRQRLKKAAQRRTLFFGPGNGPGSNTGGGTYRGPEQPGSEPEQRRKELEG